jgi:hypothetical protein
VALAELWAPGLVLAAFAGGAFGATIGALQSFTLAGFLVIVGELYRLVGRTVGVDLPVDLTNAIGFGVVLGPHVAFGGGAAALAYAAKRGYLGPTPRTAVDGGDGGEAPRDDDQGPADPADPPAYHPAKDVTRGLGSRPDVLAVGGAFGVFGHLVTTLSGTVGAPVDPVALGVVVSALAHRLAFGYAIVGPAPTGLFDVSPFERGLVRGGPGVAVDGGRGDDRRGTPDGGTAAEPTASETGTGTGTAGGHAEGLRLLVEPWLPYQYRWPDVLAQGALVGVLGAYVAYLTGSAFLAFGISVAGIVFLIGGAEDIPVTHHLTLPASTVVIALAGGATDPAAVAAAVSLPVALAAGAVAGAVGGLAGEASQRVLYAHADTHLDPPAASIVVTSFLIGLLAIVGLLPSAAWIPTP